MDFIGGIYLFGFNFEQQEYMKCSGQQLQIRLNTALFSLLGTTYGGDGVNYFKLPDLTGITPIPGMCYYICVCGLYPSRD